MAREPAIIELGQWLKTAPGRYLLAWEQACLDQSVADAFGFHALQLGLPEFEALRANRMPHRWVVNDAPVVAPSLSVGLPHDDAISTRPPDEAVALACDFDALPFPSDSIDLVVLPHTLEFAPDPHAVLREVVRVLRPELVNNRTAVERLRRQAHIAARIKHPNSVQVFDFGYSAEGAAYVVEELLSGRTLRDLINQERGLSLTHIVNLMSQICGAVHAAHLNGIVLRGLRPETIFIEQDKDGDDLVKVGGYSLAKPGEAAAVEEFKLTGPLGVFGAPEYTAPEQWMNRPLDARTDVYALGAILFELLIGAPPFAAETASEFAEQHLNAPVPDLLDFARADLTDLNEGVTAVINASLAGVIQEAGRVPIHAPIKIVRLVEAKNVRVALLAAAQRLLLRDAFAHILDHLRPGRDRHTGVTAHAMDARGSKLDPLVLHRARCRPGNNPRATVGHL